VPIQAFSVTSWVRAPPSSEWTGKPERPPFTFEERHLDGGLRLEALRDPAIHEGERAMEVEGISADEGGVSRATASWMSIADTSE